MIIALSLSIARLIDRGASRLYLTMEDNLPLGMEDGFYFLLER
jgi:hypothetical protein